MRRPCTSRRGPGLLAGTGTIPLENGAGYPTGTEPHFHCRAGRLSSGITTASHINCLPEVFCTPHLIDNRSRYHPGDGDGPKPRHHPPRRPGPSGKRPDKHSILARFRRERPVSRQPLPGGEGHYWSLTRHRETCETRRNAKLFLSHYGTSMSTIEGPEIAYDVGGMLNRDTPVHPRLRRILAKVFTPRLLKEMEGDMARFGPSRDRRGQ